MRDSLHHTYKGLSVYQIWHVNMLLPQLQHPFLFCYHVSATSQIGSSMQVQPKFALTRTSDDAHDSSDNALCYIKHWRCYARTTSHFKHFRPLPRSRDVTAGDWICNGSGIFLCGDMTLQSLLSLAVMREEIKCVEANPCLLLTIILPARNARGHTTTGGDASHFGMSR